MFVRHSVLIFVFLLFVSHSKQGFYMMILCELFPWTLILFAEKPVLNQHNPKLVGNESSFQMFSCFASSGSTPIYFEWAHNGQPVESTTSTGHHRVDNHDKVSILSIPSISRHDHGNYSCSATNAFGMDRANFSLTVQGLHSVFQCGAIVSYRPYWFPCCWVVVQLEFPLTIQPLFWWLKSKFFKMISPIHFVLICLFVKLQLSSVYAGICQNVQVYPSRFNVSLHFPDKPKLLPLIKNVELFENMTFILQCLTISGSKPIFFEWSHNGRKLNVEASSSSLSVESSDKSSLITFKNVRARDAGIYECKANNVHGHDSTTSNITIIGSSTWFVRQNVALEWTKLRINWVGPG